MRAMVVMWACLLVLQLGCRTREDAGQPVVVEPPAENVPAQDVPPETGQTGEVEPTDPAAEPVTEPEDPTAGGGDNLVIGDDPCTTDADCVPAECCHAAACVARANAPSCGDAMCTQECRFGTIDCGGGCLCHEGRCAARLSEPPPGLPQPTAP